MRRGAENLRASCCRSSRPGHFSSAKTRSSKMTSSGSSTHLEQGARLWRTPRRICCRAARVVSSPMAAEPAHGTARAGEGVARVRGALCRAPACAPSLLQEASEAQRTMATLGNRCNRADRPMNSDISFSFCFPLRKGVRGVPFATLPTAAPVKGARQLRTRASGSARTSLPDAHASSLCSADVRTASSYSRL